MSKGLNIQRRPHPEAEIDWKRAAAIRRANKALRILEKKVYSGRATRTEARRFYEWQSRMKRITEESK